MAFLTKNQIKAVVVHALETVADVSGNVEDANFVGFNSTQKHIFLGNLKGMLNTLPYNMNDGSLSHLAYYDIDLTPDSTDNWPTVKDCIDWIDDNQKVLYLN